MFIARLFLAHAARLKKSAALLLGDLRKAYYSVLLELVTGPLFTREEHQAILANLKMGKLRKQFIFSDLSNGHCLFARQPFA